MVMPAMPRFSSGPWLTVMVPRVLSTFLIVPWLIAKGSAAKEAADTNRVTANATPDKIDFMGNLPRDSGNEI